MSKKSLFVAIAAGGILILIDQIGKWYAHTHQAWHWYVFRPWLGWEYFANHGVAFGLPLPNTAVVALTPVILFLIGWWLFRGPQNTAKTFGIALIIAGATSNYIDRLSVGITIDYLRIFYSIINLADVAIVIGALLLLNFNRR